MKKRKSGEHVTRRKAIQLPQEWWSVASTLSSKAKQPVIWYLMNCIARDADKEGIDRPELPWEREYID